MAAGVTVAAGPRMDIPALDAFLAEHFPQIGPLGMVIERVDPGFVRVRIPHREGNLRPGGTISGPTLMTVADAAMYVLVLSLVGPVPLAVTTSLTINFLRRPQPGDVVAEVHCLKHGRRLVVGTVHLYSAGQDDPVAHVTATYAIPPDAAGG